MKKTPIDPDKIVKCSCGLPMRQRNWRDHWMTCGKGACGVPVTADDIAALEHYEAHKRRRDEEHREWLKAGMPGRLGIVNGTLGIVA